MNLGLQPQKDKHRFDATFSAALSAIEPVVEGVMAVASRSQAAVGREPEIETSLREALANAIIHGSDKDPNKLVQCVAEEIAGDFVVTVTDSGGRLQIEKLPDPTKMESLELGHGRGVHMMSALMDEVKITVNRGSKTEVRMVARAAPAGK
jgi:anti-sigma regulatory factor (Ser/Thr protein kinase)